ncbi:MAG: DUF1109 domain-containing protein [Myxococcaceae bacterium]
MPKLDDLLIETAQTMSPLDRARAALTAELRKPAAPSWKASLAMPVVASWFVMLAAAGALIGLGDATPLLASRLPLIISLALLTGLSGWLAVAPLGRAAPVVGAAIGLAAAAGLVLVRGAGLPSQTPEWVCGVSHVGAGLIPLGFMIAALRRAAPNPWRALAGGLAIGTTGAVIGELACSRGWDHVLKYHLGAWLMVAVVCVVLSRRVRPLSYAP